MKKPKGSPIARNAVANAVEEGRSVVGDGSPCGCYRRAPSEEVLRCGFTSGAQGAALSRASRAGDAEALAGSTARGVREGVGEPIQNGIGARALPEGTQARDAPAQTLVVRGFG